MDIKFDRNRVQEKLETFIDSNYNPLEEDKDKRKAFVTKVESYQLRYSDEVSLTPLLIEDSKDYFFNGALCFCEAINRLASNNFSWAAIELYYCIYYLCRYKLHKNGFAIFRANGLMYYLDVKASNSFELINKKKKSTPTHEGTIKIYCKVLNNSNIISNSVDGKQSLEWMKDVREIINYRAVRFYEPYVLSVFDKFSSKELMLKNLQLVENNSSYVFQPEFAVIGLPIYFFQEIKKDGADFKKLLTEERKIYLKSLIDDEFKEIIINQILELK